MNKLVLSLLITGSLLWFALSAVDNMSYAKISDSVTANEQLTKALCGNGLKDLGEACDDGNRVSSDGCSARCELERPVSASITLLAEHNPVPDATDTHRELAYHDGYAYMQGSKGDLLIYEVSPPDLKPVAHLTAADLIADLGWPTPNPIQWSNLKVLSFVDLKYLDGFLYLGGSSAKLNASSTNFSLHGVLVVDVHDPHNPHFVGASSLEENVHNLQPFKIGNRTYLSLSPFRSLPGGQQAPVKILDVTDPTAITLVYQFSNIGQVHDTFVTLYTYKLANGDQTQYRMLLGARAKGCLIYDVTKVTAPKPLARYLYQPMPAVTPPTQNYPITEDCEQFPLDYLNDVSSAMIVTDEQQDDRPLSAISLELLNRPENFGRNLGVIDVGMVGSAMASSSEVYYLSRLLVSDSDGRATFPHHWSTLGGVLAVAWSDAGLALFDLTRGPGDIRPLASYDSVSLDRCSSASCGGFATELMPEFPGYGLMSDRGRGLMLFNLGLNYQPYRSCSVNDLGQEFCLDLKEAIREGA